MSNFDNQLMVYYGIHYPIELTDVVLETAAKNPKFAKLDTDGCEIAVAKDQHVCCTTNSDRAEGASFGCIFVDEMTISGDPSDDPEHLCVDVEPSEMVKQEERNWAAVNFVADLYDLVVKDFKRKKISLKNIHLGWRAITCTFDEDESESSMGSGSFDKLNADTSDASGSFDKPGSKEKPTKQTKRKNEPVGIMKPPAKPPAKPPTKPPAKPPADAIPRAYRKKKPEV